MSMLSAVVCSVAILLIVITVHAVDGITNMSNKIKTLLSAIIVIPIVFLGYVVLNKKPDEVILSDHPRIVVDKITGKLNYKFVSKLANLVDRPNLTIVIDSTGGWPGPAYEAATIAYKNKVNIIIDRLCSSACAEYVLPSAHTVIFINNPIIGFHGNPIMGEYFETLHNIIPEEGCRKLEPDKMKELYRKIGAPENFWKNQLERLEVKKPVFKKVKGCTYFMYEFENNFWYPNSLQLKNEFGLDFEGSVCADHIACYERKLSFQWAKGTRLAVGEDIFISRGRFWVGAAILKHAFF